MNNLAKKRKENSSMYIEFGFGGACNDRDVWLMRKDGSCEIMTKREYWDPLVGFEIEFLRALKMREGWNGKGKKVIKG